MKPRMNGARSALLRRESVPGGQGSFHRVGAKDAKKGVSKLCVLGLFAARFFLLWPPALLAGGAWAQLPEGPGKEETLRICGKCHELERSVSVHQNEDGWLETMDKMVALGAKVTDEEFSAILKYLAKNFPAEELPKLNVNKATAIELESRLTLTRSQAAAIIQYRAKKGPFKSFEDLKKVPGLDVAKIEAKKDRLAF
jgi:competence protein ComEA